MTYQYKAQELIVPQFGDKYWCDMGHISETQEEAQKCIEDMKKIDSYMLIEAYRIVRRPVPEWEEVVKEVVENDR